MANDEPGGILSGLPSKKPASRRKREPRRHLNVERSGGESPTSDGKVCGGLKRDGTSTCTREAGAGTSHPGYGRCGSHGGQTEAGQKSAAYDMAGELMSFYGTPIDTDPIQALLDEVKRASGHTKWLGDRINRMGVDPEDAELGANAPLPPAVLGWIQVYQSERGQLVRAAKAALDAGINERLVQIAEWQGRVMGDAIEQILHELDLSPAQLARVPQVVPNVMRGLMSGAAPQLIEGTVDEQPE
jgi:hypothetical protein